MHHSCPYKQQNFSVLGAHLVVHSFEPGFKNVGCHPCLSIGMVVNPKAGQGVSSRKQRGFWDFPITRGLDFSPDMLLMRCHTKELWCTLLPVFLLCRNHLFQRGTGMGESYKRVQFRHSWRRPWGHIVCTGLAGAYTSPAPQSHWHLLHLHLGQNTWSSGVAEICRATHLTFSALAIFVIWA